MNNRNIIKKNQYKGLKHLQRTLDNFFSDIWWSTPGLSEAWEEFQPQSKLVEDKDKYRLEVSLPGIKKEDMKIEVEENIVKISGERKEEKEEGTKEHYSEIFHGKFYREFVLPTLIKKEKIKARHENGVLMIDIPKETQSKAHQVNIE
jgi:HSP20 family protein